MKDSLSPMLQRSVQNHRDNANREGVHYHVGQVFRHKNFGYRVRLQAKQPANDTQPQGCSEVSLVLTTLTSHTRLPACRG